MTRLAGSSKLLRAMNESATLALLLEKGTLTRAELRELTGLSKPTTSDVLRTLTDVGFASVIGHTSGGPGPNAEIYAINPAAAHVVALSVRDITETAHSAVGAALCDLAGTVLARAEYDVDPSDPISTVATTVDDLCGRAGLERSAVTHVQLAVPGSYDPSSDTIRHIDLAEWGRPGLVSELATRMDTTVWAENDVNLAAIAERHRGVAAGSHSFALLWFGAGLGCAIDLGDSLLRGVSGGAGELGYVPVGQSGKDLQDLVGGPAVLALAAEHGYNATTAEAAVANAVSHVEGRATENLFLRELAERIALALAAVSAILDPPLVVLAGEVAQAGGGVLRDLVADAFHSATPLRTPVEVTALTDDAVLLGALDAGLRVVRDSLIDSLRHALTPA
ncbi:MAG TPA: XylR family transcriptional regulator [Micromonosporaceae bacterium]|nr:XylR family transcriptional regulator [Micromonosporaceae bacterium]HCU52408.1 XylR family transcriptional regulator [Micromonosporaceae bacterium]